MSDHLPECDKGNCDCIGSVEHGHWSSCASLNMCICPALRACEQRVEARTMYVVGPHNYKQGVKDGHAAGVQAAREAVAGMENALGYPASDFDHIKEDALDLLDALREGKK